MGDHVHTNRLTALFAGACLAVLALGATANAGILINVDKSAQRMTVTVDGRARYQWPVSTGRHGYDTPTGTFSAYSMDRDHRSKEYDDAPMPYSIFFTATGIAVHGTLEARNLGRAVSHGCVRLSVKNAATLWDLVSREGVWSTTVIVNGGTSHGGPKSVRARVTAKLDPAKAARKTATLPVIASAD